MPAHLECHTPPYAGKLLMITAEKPVVIKTNKADEAAGEVRIEIDGDGFLLTNRSRLQCTVNGVPHMRKALVPGDRVLIGKQTFTLHVEDDQDSTNTQLIAPPEAPNERPCSVCDQPFAAADRTHGWVSGDRCICRRCLSKGVKPENLAASGPVEPDPDLISAPPTYLDGPIDSFRNSGDSDVVEPGAHLGPVEDATASLSASDAPSDSDRQRKQRRLSASRLAQVEPANGGKPGLFSKVGSVFSSNREERRRLEALEEERRGLLEQAGRLALTEHNGFGVPEHLMGPLLKGVAVTLRVQDLSITALERWRALRQRLALLDAEITALRATLALGPDPGPVNQPEPLRADRLERQNRTFAALDAVGTEDLAGDEAAKPAKSTKPARPPAEVAAEARTRGVETRAETKPAPAKPTPAQPDRQSAISERRRALRRRR